MRKTAEVILYLLLVFSINGFSIQKGNKYHTGFQYFELHDSTRQYCCNNDTVLRPLLLHFWYPSEERFHDPMLYRTYIDLIAIREDYSKSKDQVDKESINFVSAYLGFAQKNYNINPDLDAGKILDSPVNAVANVEVRKGKFPLIIYAPSNSKEAMQNHLILEKLAAEGYYVISVASAGPDSKIFDNSAESILAQVRDMEFILKYVDDALKLNYSGIGVLSFSSGGLASSIFQQKNKDVKAVVSLDGSQEYSFYPTLFNTPGFVQISEVPYYLLANATVPTIYPYYTALNSDKRFFSKMRNVSHFAFVSFWSFFDSCDSSGTNNNPYLLAYNTIIGNVLSFFDFYLMPGEKTDSQLKTFTRSGSELEIDDMKDYTGSVAILNDYLTVGIDEALSRFKNVSVDEKQQCSEDELSILGRMLIDRDLDAAFKIFELNNMKHPDSWHSLYELGYTYKLLGSKELALETLAKARELNPENVEIYDLINEMNSKKN